MKARFFALAALVLGLASCQQEFDGATVGGEVDFQLNVAAPDFGTRADQDGRNGHSSAYGAIDYLSEDEWQNVDLRYTLEVYDAEGLDKAPVKDRMVKVLDKYEPVVFDLRLVPNRDYQFVIFADFVTEDATELPTVEAQADLGLHHTIGATLQYITLKDDAINTELTDAYFASEKIRVSNSAAQDIVLRRPYGKVRVIATDLHELNLNVEAASVKVDYTVANANGFNAVTGAISGNGATTFEATYDVCDEYTEGYDAITATALNGTVRHSHKTLSTDYILATNTQNPIHFDITVYDQNGDEIKKTEFNTDIPVQRNYLTTIIGNVLTTATEVNVSIDDNFYGEYNVNYVGVASARELQEALNNVKAGETNVINFEADINAVEEKINTVIITESAETTINLIGNGYKFNGCMQIKGMSEYKNAHTVFTNIKFETTDASTFMGDAFIFCDDEPNTSFRYPDSVTIKDCSFTAAGNAEKKAVGAKFWSLENNFIVENCSATGMHSLIQLTSCGKANVTVDGATIENSNNGISLGEVTTATIKDVDINAIGYGIRLNGGPSVTTTIENAKIAAFIPVNVRKLNNEAYNVKVEFLGEENELTGNTYEIAFCSNEYEEGVAPAAPVGTFRLQNAEEARAYYGDVTSFSALDAAINSTNNPTVTAEANITKIGEGIEVERDVILDFANYEFNAGSDATSRWYALEIYGDYDVNIQNANFTRAGIYAGENANVVFENGTINHKPERSSRYIFCAQSGSTITIKGGDFLNDRQNNAYFWADNATIIVEGGNFAGVASKNKVVLSNGGQVIIKGGTFNFDPTAYLAKGYLATKNGSMWVVALEDLSETLASAEDRTIYLAEGNDYGTLTAGELKNVTIVANDSAAVRFVTTADSKLENVTIQNAKFEFATGAGQKNGAFVVIDAAAQINNLVVEGCTIVGDGKKNSYGIYGQNPSASIVVKDCNFSNLGYAIQATAGGGYESLTVENCSFANINSWVIMPQYGFNGDLTVTGCTFDCCSDGLIKTGAFNGNIFTFTNNAITNSAGHDGKDSKWFEVNASAATKVVSGNTKDGAEWTPADAEGLK